MSRRVLYLVSAFIFLVSSFAVSALAQSALKQNAQGTTNAIRLTPVVRTSRETGDVSCWNRHDALTGSRLVRSPLLVSPNSSYQAYVEVQAIAFRPKDSATYVGPLCENTSRLFVKSSTDNAFHVAYLETPATSSGNSLKIIDWSADATHLLVERGQWVYESDDGAYTDLLIFDPRTGHIAVPDLATVLAGRFGKDCWSDNSVLGFTQDGQAVLAVDPFSNVVALMNGAISCVKRRTRVALDSVGDLRTLPKAYKLRHFGQFLPYASVTKLREKAPLAFF